MISRACFPTSFVSGVARAFPGGRVAHLESQNEEENEKSLRKNKKKLSKFGGKIRKVELLPTQDCEASWHNVNLFSVTSLSWSDTR